MEPLTLATTVVGAFLVPFLKEGARRLGEALTGATGDPAARQLVETSETLWERVRGLLTAPDEQKALEAFQQYPEELQQRFSELLAERLRSDDQLRAQLEEMVTRPVPGHSGSGAQIMQAQYAAIIDNRKATITGGTFIGQQLQASPPPPARPENGGQRS